MTSPNGRLTEAELVHVSAVETLSTLTARAYRHLVIAGAAHGIKVTLASPGAAYRSWAVQDEMRRGSLGDRALAAKWGLNPNSSVPLAGPGYSTHGTGTRVDLLFNGSSWPTAAHLALARLYGFSREFGADDPNHFAHDGHTAIQALTDAQVAAAHLYPHEDGKPNPVKPTKPGRTFYTATTGKPNATFWRRLEWAAGCKAFPDSPGKAEWAAIQTWLKRSWGYVGTIDGDPGQLTKEALQRVAARGGYSGPIDGDPQAKSWQGVAKYLNTQ